MVLNEKVHVLVFIN